MRIVMWLGALVLALVVVFGLRPERVGSSSLLDDRVAEDPERMSQHAHVELALRPAAEPEAAGSSAEAALGQRESVSTPVSTVSGRVEVEGGLPAGDRHVVVAIAHRAGVSRLHSRRYESTAATDGSFAVQVPADTRSVTLDLVAPLVTLGDEVEVRPGARAVVLRAELLATVRGRVHVPPGLAGEASAAPTIVVRAGDSARTSTDPDGTFEVLVEPDVPFSIVAITREDVVGHGPASRSSSVEVAAIARGGERWVDVYLAPWGAIRGCVVDANGNALEGVTVQIAADFGALPDPRGEPPATGPDGAFALGALQPGEREILVRAPAYRSRRVSAAVRGGEVTTLTVRLDRCGIVRGRVVRPDGTSCARARVHRVDWRKAPRYASKTGQLWLEREVLRALAPGDPELERGQTLTDEEGRFTLADDGDDVGIVAEASGFAGSAQVALALAPGEERNDLVLTLRPACALRVHAIGEEGALMSKVLTFRSEDGTTRQLSLGCEGEAEDDSLPPGKAWIALGPLLVDAGSRRAAELVDAVEVELAPGTTTQAELRVRRAP